MQIDDVTVHLERPLHRRALRVCEQIARLRRADSPIPEVTMMPLYKLRRVGAKERGHRPGSASVPFG